MQKKTLIINLLSLWIILFFGSCQKEDLEGKLRLTAEKIQNPTKVAIDGTVTEWVNGDQVRINNSTKTVSVEGALATIESDGLSSPYHAVYPASLAADSDLTSGSVTVELPDEYTYLETSDGHQKLDLPMAAYSSSVSDLNFKHLTAALMVRVTNSFGSTMYLREIKIESDLSQLSGSRTIDLTSAANIMNQSAIDDGVTPKQKQVRMLFMTPLEIASGYKDILIPVCPVSNNNKFTVTVVATNGTSCYTFSRTQTGGAENTDRSLVRNQMGYVPVEMSTGSSYIGSSTMVSSVSEYKAMVTAINSATSGTLNYTINGTIDFSNGYADSIVLKSGVTLNINGINNATLRNLKFRTYSNNSNNYCGWITALNNTNSTTLSNITIENVDMSEASDNNRLRAGAFLSLASGALSLTNCTTRNITFPPGTSSSTNKEIGGLIGSITGTCTINNCSFEQNSDISLSPNATNSYYLGCILGFTHYSNGTNTTNISNCTVKANSLTITTNASIDIGGIAGSLKYSTNVTNCIVQNCDGSDNMILTINCSASFAQHIGGICGYASNDSLQTYNNNRIQIAITENKSTTANTWIGVIFGYIKTGYTASNSKLAGTGNDVTGTSLTLIGTGNNTNYGSSTYMYLIGEIPTPNNVIPTGFAIGTPTFTGR